MRVLIFAAAVCALGAGAVGAKWFRTVVPTSDSSNAMFLAPMIGVIEPCIQQPSGGLDASSLVRACTGPSGSAGALVESTLQALQKPGEARSEYALGYTLPIPLLQLFQRNGNDWEINQTMVQRLVRTIHDADRPLIMYLFSTHFAAHAPIEEHLATDPLNMSHTRDGALGRDVYYDTHVYNWTFADTQNALTERRAQAIRAVLAETCRLDAVDRKKIRGITLLGELHHLFPDFQGGMGFNAPYRVSDYSQASLQQFRRFIAQEFQTIEKLNRVMGADYRSFEEVAPPSKDIRTEPLTRFTEHIDSFAHGTFPVSGWAYVPEDKSRTYEPRVHIYRNGLLAARTGVHLSRQDVLASKPEFGTANTGWRFDMDFRAWPAGQHRLDIFLELRPGHLIPMGTRHVAIMDRSQSTPLPMPQETLPHAQRDTQGIQAYIDFPADQSAYYHNPLVAVWHQFRARQVTDYLQHFAAEVHSSCLTQIPLYTHQIVPFTNPSWDQNKYAIEDSLRPHPGIRLGVSLYGEPTYGTSFSQWFARSGHSRYGITEFHPLKSLDAPQMLEVFERHRQQGAEFLSFFAEPVWEGRRVPRPENIFSFDTDNPKFQSDALYRAVQQSLRLSH